MMDLEKVMKKQKKASALTLKAEFTSVMRRIDSIALIDMCVSSSVLELTLLDMIVTSARARSSSHARAAPTLEPESARDEARVGRIQMNSTNFVQMCGQAARTRARTLVLTYRTENLC